MQRGQIIRRHGAWHVRYRLNGKQICQKLTDCSDEYRTLKSVKPLADDVLRPINQGRASGPQTLQEFVEITYLPYVEKHRRPSTYRGYKNLYAGIAGKIGPVRLASYRTVDAQRLLDKIAAGSDLAHTTFIHIKSFLSGIFTYAKRMGAFDGANPVVGTEVPKGKPSESTYAYSKEEIDRMSEILTGVSRLAVIVAAYTGLRLGELQGLQWPDLTDTTLTVNRTVWHGIEGPPKTAASQAAIPLIPIVRGALSEYHRENPQTKWVFESPFVRPYDLATLGSKRIKPTLAEHGIIWHAWHPMRRGFATRLHEAGVQDRIIQALCRHSNMSVTMKSYVKALPAANVEAMQKLNPTA